MTDTWKMNMDKGMIVGAIFVDFKKAFDSISHNILSLKLQAIGLSGNLHEWAMDATREASPNFSHWTPPGIHPIIKGSRAN